MLAVVESSIVTEPSVEGGTNSSGEPFEYITPTEKDNDGDITSLTIELKLRDEEDEEEDDED